MSYEIAKSIDIDNKNKKIFLRSSSNNIYPKEYSRWEYMKEEPNLEIKKRKGDEYEFSKIICKWTNNSSN